MKSRKRSRCPPNRLDVDGRPKTRDSPGTTLRGVPSRPMRRQKKIPPCGPTELGHPGGHDWSALRSVEDLIYKKKREEGKHAQGDDVSAQERIQNST